MFFPVLSAGFVLVDDHEIIALTPPIGSSLRPPIDVRSMALESDPSVGRFRPLYWTVRLNEVMAFGDDARAWHATVLGFGLLAAVLVFFTARGLGATHSEGLLIGAWLLVAPGVSSLWVRLGADDTLATVFLCLAALCAVRAARGSKLWDVAFVVSAAACFLSKEAFALTALALAGLRTLPTSWPRVPLAAWIVFGLGVAEVAVVFLVGARAGPLSYGGRYLAIPSLAAYARSLVQNAAILAYVGMAWLVPLVLSRASTLWRSRAWLIGSLAAVVLVGPQLVLYSQQGIFEGKYEAAAALGVAGWTVLTLSLGRCLRLYRPALGAWAAVVVLFGFSTWTYAGAFAADSQELAALVQQIADSARPGAVVGIAADAARQYEPINSLADHIAHQGRGDLQLRVLPLAPDRPYTPLEASFAQALATSSFEQPALSECTNVSAVVVLGDEAQTLGALPCLAAYKRVELTRQVLVWGGDAVSLRPRLPGVVPVGYVVYVAAP